MTIFFGVADSADTAGNIPAPPGAAPVGTGLMQGNPQASQFKPFGVYPPSPQAGGAAQTVSTPLVNHLISTGAIPLNAHPTNIAAPPGTDSLLAQMARGQIMLNQSTYGQGGFIPQNGGCSPQVASPAANAVQSVSTGAAGGLTYANPCTYTGN